MNEYNRAEIGAQAAKLGFIRDAFEKTSRLAGTLSFFARDPLLADHLAIKGGTAINLTIFNLPRLSIDIDVDFAKNLPLDETMAAREAIQDTIERFMTMSGYTFSAEKSKRYHTLDSFVYQYTNAGGVRDNIKIEINYSLRSHVLPLVRRPIETLDVFEPVSLLSLDSIEIFAAKTIALFTRTAARDLYDLNNMVYFGLFDETQLDIFRKCIVFYSAVGSEFTLETFDPARIDALTQREIRTRLTPMLRKKDRFDLPAAITRVKGYLSSLLCLTEKEKQFLAAFRAGEYHPEMIFDGDILARVSHHPMAEWKMLGYARSHDTERSETEKASVLAQIHASSQEQRERPKTRRPQKSEQDDDLEL